MSWIVTAVEICSFGSKSDSEEVDNICSLKYTYLES